MLHMRVCIYIHMYTYTYRENSFLEVLARDVPRLHMIHTIMYTMYICIEMHIELCPRSAGKRHTPSPPTKTFPIKSS